MNLFFPRLCLHCLLTLNKREPLDLCPICQNRLDRRKSLDGWSSLMADRIEFTNALRHCKTMISMTGDDEMHTLIHSLKYGFMDYIGIELGRQFGTLLIEYFTPKHVLLPIPIHRNRLLKRGYNQALKICEGINLALPYDLQIISSQRNQSTDTQTKLGRGSRSENVEGIFTIHEPKQLHNKDIWVIDDVITTGATVHEMCKTVFLCRPNSISIATLAITV